jgi:aminodeoxychorismate lyase
MIVYLNGQFVPEEQAVVSVFDRSFLYGDGLFEVARICNGKPFRWAQHVERFMGGAAFLKINVPVKAEELHGLALELVKRNRMTEALLRISLSRGVGIRGYSPKGAEHPTLVMTLHAAPKMGGKPPPGWRVMTASRRLPANEPLAQFKNCNKLPQILARAEADAAGADDALLLNTAGEVVEASSSNLFWIRDNVVCTPPLASGILAGVTRLVVLEICGKLGIQAKQEGIKPEGLLRVQGVFLSMSSWGVVEVESIDQHAVHRAPLAKKIRKAYQEMLRKECA